MRSILVLLATHGVAVVVGFLVCTSFSHLQGSTGFSTRALFLNSHQLHFHQRDGGLSFHLRRPRHEAQDKG